MECFGLRIPVFFCEKYAKESNFRGSGWVLVIELTPPVTSSGILFGKLGLTGVVTVPIGNGFRGLHRTYETHCELWILIRNETKWMENVMMDQIQLIDFASTYFHE